MVDVKCLLFLALVVSTLNIIECKGGRGGGGRGGGHGSHGSHGSHGGHGSRGSHTSSHSSHGSTGSSSRGKSSSGSSSHTYPASSGYSGHGTGGSHTYPASPGLSGGGSWSSRHVPTYYTSPQHVYVTQYRHSESRYSDLLTGLTMYNLGRSHGVHHHYYHDHYYYRRSTVSPSSVQHYDSYMENKVEEESKDEATCVMRIKENGQEETFKIPCAIVSTFDNGTRTNCSSVVNKPLKENPYSVYDDMPYLNNNFGNNTTPCGNITVGIVDPLNVKGEPVDASNMECLVEIRTKEEVIQNNMDCKILLQYAKMPVPENKSTKILPPRKELKALLDKPPWWLSLLIAV